MEKKVLKKMETSLRMYKSIPKRDDTMQNFSWLMSEYLSYPEIPDKLHNLLEEVDEKNAWMQMPDMTIAEIVSRKLSLHQALTDALAEVELLLKEE